LANGGTGAFGASGGLGVGTVDGGYGLVVGWCGKYGLVGRCALWGMVILRWFWFGRRRVSRYRVMRLRVGFGRALARFRVFCRPSRRSRVRWSKPGLGGCFRGSKLK
jgi:hypothetical protein